MISQRKVEQAAAAIRRRWSRTPQLGLILGTGLGHLAAQIDADETFTYEELPHFPCSTAPGHAGRLICGSWRGCPVLAMQGRCHLYEGYTAQQVALPVRVMSLLGVPLLVASNASGGLNPAFAAGDVMLITDHINLLGSRLKGLAREEAFGRAARGSVEPYDPRWMQTCLRLARQQDIPLRRGVYVAVTGPNYETRAEYRALRRIGGDAVGMSTVPEVLAASASGIRTLALSVITNVASPDAPRSVCSSEVITAAAGAAAKLEKIVRGVAAAVCDGEAADQPPRRGPSHA